MSDIYSPCGRTNGSVMVSPIYSLPHRLQSPYRFRYPLIRNFLQLSRNRCYEDCTFCAIPSGTLLCHWSYLFPMLLLPDFLSQGVLYHRNTLRVIRIKELRVLYSAGTFKTSRVRLPLAMNILKVLIVVVK